MRRMIFLLPFLFISSGCSLGSNSLAGTVTSPRNEIRTYPSGEKSEMDYATGSYTVWYKNGRMMFRASNWNGNAATTNATWQPRGNRIRRQTLWGHKTDRIFDYGLSEGRTILWGAYDRYEGWYEDGKRQYLYDVKGRTYTEWNREGAVADSNP
ncbi:MAG: hypothetical protein ACYC9O_15515 [Candidatus Latescibacterota bacterium]